MPPSTGPTAGKAVPQAAPRSAPRNPTGGRGAPSTPRRARKRPPRRGFPRTASLYIAAEILRIFAVAVFAIAFVYITVIAFQLVRDGIRLDFVWPHVLRTISYPLFFSIPLAFLFGITLGIGRMANDHELSALKVHGLSHGQLAAPVFIVGLVLSGLTFWLAGWVLPDVHYEQANLRKTILDQLKDLGSGDKRTILLPGDVSLWVQHYDGPHLRGLVLDIQKGDRSQILPEIGAAGGTAVRQHLAMGQLAGKVTLVAREADLEVAPDRTKVILLLTGVEIQIPELVESSRGIDVFHQTCRIEKLPLPLSFARRGESAKDLTNPELLRWIGGLRSQILQMESEVRTAGRAAAVAALTAGAGDGAGGGAAALEAMGREISSLQRKVARGTGELYSRFSFSLACLTFPLVAFPLVMLLERHSRLTHFFFGNLAVVTLFFPLLMAAHIAVDRGWPPALVLILPNAALALLGAPMLRAMCLR